MLSGILCFLLVSWIVVFIYKLKRKKIQPTVMSKEAESILLLQQMLDDIARKEKPLENIRRQLSLMIADHHLNINTREYAISILIELENHVKEEVF